MCVERRDVFARRDGRCDVSPRLSRRIERKNTFGGATFGRIVGRNRDISRTTRHGRCGVHGSNSINRRGDVGRTEESGRANGLESVFVGKFVILYSELPQKAMPTLNLK